MNTTAYAVLRDRGHWRGRLRGLAVQADGDLSLERVPAPVDGRAVDIPTSYPCARVVSGLALGPCGAIFVADTAEDRILFVDGLCGTREWLPMQGQPTVDAPGHFVAPRGLAVGAGYLVVADSGHGALQRLAIPRLEANLSLHAGGAPSSIAFDGQGRLLVIDGGARSLQRIDANGNIDARFATQLGQITELQSPFSVAVGAADAVLVSDSAANTVFVFDAEGRAMSRLTGPAGWLPGVVVARGTRAYVADAATGAVLVFEASTWVGSVEGWRGPVTAMAIGERGELFIKAGLDERFATFAPDAACVATGELEAGPFDAGEGRCWERAWIDADVPPQGNALLELALRPDPGPPLPGDWTTLPTPDALLAGDATCPGRFVWLRLRLRAASARSAPVIRQIRCATAAEDYLDHLPSTFRRHDQDGFLSRWLKLLRGEFGRIEAGLDDLPRLAAPEFVSPDALRWLAHWLALELPQIADDAERRALISQAVAMFARRGTPDSIARFVELHTGIRPAIVEAFSERRVWVLGLSSRLGFDTRLAVLEPDGVVVPEGGSELGPCAGPAGSSVVGASGPLLPDQMGLTLFADEAYRFCVVVDAYRVRDPALLGELFRIVDREKPAHTDYRVQVVAPDMRVGFQARIGIDAIVGGEPPALPLGAARLGVDSRVPSNDVSRAGAARLDGTLTLQ
ncbi:phage tail protein [Variovorax sp. YR752]|uniref:phage tail protein n=1 Tax=Variovorax sp. YR752 TaxID=1884383 RepID=UPI00313776AA